MGAASLARQRRTQSDQARTGLSFFTAKPFFVRRSKNLNIGYSTSL
jgi:hypothetical protein